MQASKLNLGCGNKTKDGFFGVDLYPCAGADLLCDITRTLPFRNATITAVYLDNVIEHVLDIPALMQEIVRICRDGAAVTIVTPHFSCLDSWRDPTHLHHLSYFSADHFEKPSARHYIGGGLRVRTRHLSFSRSLLGRIGHAFFRLSPTVYEKQLCFLFRARTLQFELNVDKPLPEDSQTSGLPAQGKRP